MDVPEHIHDLSNTELEEVVRDDEIQLYASGHLCANCARALRVAFTWNGHDAEDDTSIIPAHDTDQDNSEE
jgi:hypothetical protein